jgi:hypothetical protein
MANQKMQASTLTSNIGESTNETVNDHPLSEVSITATEAASSGAAATTKKISRLLCPECRLRPVLYQCPRCRRRTCSLDCCRAHKQRYQCNGKRDKTAFINLGSMTDATLASDFHFLEEIIGQMDSRSTTTESKRQRRTNHAANNETATVNTAAATAVPLHPLLQASCNSVQGRIQTLVSSSVEETTHHTNDETIQRHWHKPPHPRSGGGGGVASMNSFQQRAALLGITVWRLPDALERHQRNQSHVKMVPLRSSNAAAAHRNETTARMATMSGGGGGGSNDRGGKKMPESYWTVEWCWYHSNSSPAEDDDAVTSVDSTCASSREAAASSDRSHVMSGLLHNVPESQSLTILCQRILQSSPELGTLACALDDVSILVPRIPSPAHRPVFVAIASPPLHSHGTMTLVEGLRDLTVIEYPTLHIVPSDRRHEFALGTLPLEE